MLKLLLDEHISPDVAKGLRRPNRALEVLNDEDYRLMIDANMNGPYYVVQAFLPGMRQQGRGTIVNVISDSALGASVRTNRSDQQRKRVESAPRPATGPGTSSPQGARKGI